ncbi:MAG: hypothetical protein HKN47_03195 [Pirellulaceae bacterium]|nr:hypothetical protein [Pirellulaceae bacterium]
MNLLDIALISAIIILLAILAVLFNLLRWWFQCYLAGAPVAAFQIVAMHLRRTPIKLICEQRIRAKYVGVELSAQQLEEAHLHGADIKKAVDALCLAKRNDQQVSWQDLIAGDLGEQND